MEYLKNDIKSLTEQINRLNHDVYFLNKNVEQQKEDIFINKSKIKALAISNILFGVAGLMICLIFLM